MIESLLFPLVPERFKEDERYRKGQINIINALPGRRIMGVHIPDMKELAKQLAKRDDPLFLLESLQFAGNVIYSYCFQDWQHKTAGRCILWEGAGGGPVGQGAVWRAGKGEKTREDAGCVMRQAFF